MGLRGPSLTAMWLVSVLAGVLGTSRNGRGGDSCSAQTQFFSDRAWRGAQRLSRFWPAEGKPGLQEDLQKLSFGAV